MSAAYVDTSALVAVAFGERGAAALASRLGTFPRLLSSNLLEAEIRAACSRERVAVSERLLANLEWVLPDRPLGQEITAVLAAGYLRGADLWHVAAALYVAPAPGDLTFITRDRRQRTVAAALGFQV